MTFSVTEFKSNLKRVEQDLLFQLTSFSMGYNPPHSEFLLEVFLPASNIGTHEVFFHGKT